MGGFSVKELRASCKLNSSYRHYYTNTVKKKLQVDFMRLYDEVHHFHDWTLEGTILGNMGTENKLRIQLYFSYDIEGCVAMIYNNVSKILANGKRMALVDLVHLNTYEYDAVSTNMFSFEGENKIRHGYLFLSGRLEIVCENVEIAKVNLEDRLVFPLHS